MTTHAVPGAERCVEDVGWPEWPCIGAVSLARHSRAIAGLDLFTWWSARPVGGNGPHEGLTLPFAVADRKLSASKAGGRPPAVCLVGGGCPALRGHLCASQVPCEDSAVPGAHALRHGGSLSRSVPFPCYQGQGALGSTDPTARPPRTAGSHVSRAQEADVWPSAVAACVGSTHPRTTRGTTSAPLRS